MVRNILGAVSQFERASIVEKLRKARDRKSADRGRRIEGRKPYRETHPDLLREAKRLARRSPKTGSGSLRQIAAELAMLGFARADGAPFNAQTVKNIIGARCPSKKWQRLDGSDQLAEIVRGVRFRDGEKLTERAA